MRKFFTQKIDIIGRYSDGFAWQDKAAYAQFLAQTYYYVIHSTRLLAAAAARFAVEDEKLHRRFLDHTREERSHHLLALHDLEHLDCSIDRFPELPATAALYECQYYKCEHADPAAFLGYVLALEGLSVTRGRQVHAAVREQFGENASTFLRLHAEDDIEHLDSAFRVIEALAPSRVESIERNLLQSCRLYGLFLEGISEASRATAM